VQVMDLVAEALRCGGCTIHDEQTFHELASIDASTNKAPEGRHDDCADAFGIALFAAEMPVYKLEVAAVDLPGARQQYQRPTDGECGEGIAFSAMSGDYAVTLPLKVATRNRSQKVVNLGNYQSELEARHAHGHGGALLGYPVLHRVDEGELTVQARAAIEPQVRAKLVAAGQLQK